MPNHLSLLGIFHTLVGVLAVIVALVGFFREGKINPGSMTGRLYIGLTLIACLTTFGLMRTGHFSVGHILSTLILVLLGVGVFTSRYIQTVALSLTVLLSMIPTTVETLTRLPLDQPIAQGPDSPAVQMGILTCVVTFVVGVFFQIKKIRTSNQAS